MSTNETALPYWPARDLAYRRLFPRRLFPEEWFDISPKNDPVHCCPVCLGQDVRLTASDWMVCVKCAPEEFKDEQFVAEHHARRPSAADYARAIHSPDPEVRRSAARRLRCRKAGLKAAEANRAHGWPNFRPRPETSGSPG